MHIPVGWLAAAMAFGLAGSGAAQPSPVEQRAVVQLHIEIDRRPALASAVLVHREERSEGVVLYFLTSESLLSLRLPPPSPPETEGEDGDVDRTVADVAVIRLLIEKSALAPAAVTLEPPAPGAAFFIVGHTAAGERIMVPQRAQSVSTSSATGDTELAWAGCLGAPAFTERGVFGIVSRCEPGRPPVIALLSSARGLLRRLVPGMDLGSEGSLRFGIGD
jgi:hypothetical protein